MIVKLHIYILHVVKRLFKLRWLPVTAEDRLHHSKQIIVYLRGSTFFFSVSDRSFSYIRFLESFGIPSETKLFPVGFYTSSLEGIYYNYSHTRWIIFCFWKLIISVLKFDFLSVYVNCMQIIFK